MKTQAPTRELDALVAEHGGRVTRVCRAVLRSDDLARDAAQEAFVRLWRRMQREPALEHPGAWLQAAALSSALDLARRRATIARAEDERRIPHDAPAPSADAPPERARAAEFERAFDSALGELPEGQRTVFVLRHRAGLPLCEIAELLDLALPTVKTHFARAALRLQARLARFSDRS